MHDSFLRPESQRHDHAHRDLWPWARALICVLGAWVALSSSAALADVYSEVNDKINSSQWAAAQSLIDRQLQKQPADPQIRLMQSQMQTALGQTAQAIETLTALTQEFPELPEPYNNLAVVLAGQERFDEALTALTLAVRARPDYGLALENLGDVHIALAQQAYRKAQNLPLQGPLGVAGQRLQSKIKLSVQLLQAAKP